MGWKACTTAVVFSLLALAAPAHSTPATVTVDQVLAHPTLYEGKAVRVRGFATFEFENNRLWRDETAFRTYQPDRALRVDTMGLTQSTRDAAKGRLAYVTGTFRSDEYNLALKDVTSVQRDPTDHGPDRGWWSDPDFTALLVMLGALGVVVAAFTFGLGARGLALQPGWKPRKPTI